MESTRNKSAETVWSIPHLRESILSNLFKRDILKLLRVNRFYFETIILHGDLYKEITSKVYRQLNKHNSVQRNQVYFNTVQEVNAFGDSRRFSGKTWNNMMDDCPNLKTITQQDKTLHRTFRKGEHILDFRWICKDNMILGKPYPRAEYPPGVHYIWILRPTLHIYIRGNTGIKTMEAKSRVFSDTLATRIRGLNGRLEALDIGLALPTKVILETIHDLSENGHVALKDFGFIQGDDDVVELVNSVLPALQSLDVNVISHSSAKISQHLAVKPSVISLPDFLGRFNWSQSYNLEYFILYCRLPAPNEIARIHLQTPAIPGDMLPIKFLDKAEFHLTFDREIHPLNNQIHSAAYLDFIRQFARAMFPLLDPDQLGRKYPIISSDSYRPHTTGTKLLSEDIDHSNTFHTAFHKELRRLRRSS